MTVVVRKAPAFATVQDSGRVGFRASGVPLSGAMDAQALLTLNALLGNASDAAGIECALTGGEFEFESPCAFAIGGAQFTAALNGNPVDAYKAQRAATGDVLEIGNIANGRFVYVAFAGGLDLPVVMGSRSTYTPGGFGGLEGRRLRNGDSLSVRAIDKRRARLVMNSLPIALRPPTAGSVRVVIRDSPEILLDAEWKVSAASDRTGYRLDGTAVIFGASITSEPVCPGVIQLPPSGEPIVLMADAPTIGGYRILGTVISADLGLLAQMTPGVVTRFESLTVEAAQREAGFAAERIEAVRTWALS